MMNRILTAAAALLATSALAVDLKGAIQDRLMNNGELSIETLLQNQLAVKDCNVCAIDGPLEIAPNTERTAASCCSRNFRECPEGEGRCRFLAEYTIPAASDSGANVEVCPGTGPEGCICQQQLAQNFNVSIRLCPTAPNCCAKCKCIGDPHCTDFQGQVESWVVCDTRDGDCNFPRGPAMQQKCNALTYMGDKCQVRADLTGKLFCQYPLSQPDPTMNMYTKTYIKNGVTQTFSIYLSLGVFGSIDKVTITDAGQVYTFEITTIGNTKKLQCTIPPNLSSIASLPFHNGVAVLDKLPSGLRIVLSCFIRNSMWGSRWEVTSLEDEFIADSNDRSGFCQTGDIPESTEPLNQCTIDRRILNSFAAWGYGCASAGITFAPTPASDAVADEGAEVRGFTLSSCKRAWCTKTSLADYTTFNWQLAGFNSIFQCQNYVGRPGDNFLEAVCAVAPTVNLKNPALCSSNEACRDCMDALKDYPDEIDTVLRPTRTAACNVDALLELGLANANDPEFVLLTGGVKILYTPFLSPVETLIWVANDADITAWVRDCGCTDFISQTLLSQFTAAGTYRIQQCFPNNEFVPDQCSGAPGYTVRVNYPTSVVTQDVSIPYGTLVEDTDLVCAAKTNCPPNSQCCIWPKGGAGWKQCLGPLAQQFPNCGV